MNLIRRANPVLVQSIGNKRGVPRLMYDDRSNP